MKTLVPSELCKGIKHRTWSPGPSEYLSIWPTEIQVTMTFSKGRVSPHSENKTLVKYSLRKYYTIYEIIV